MRGRRRGQMLAARAGTELTTARVEAGLSIVNLAREAGLSKSALSRLLAGEVSDLGVIQLSEVASVLGFEISLELHPIGDPIRDKGQLAVARRFEALLSEASEQTDEMLLPGAGEQRAWDKLLELSGADPPYRVGVDIETRVRDIQALTRRTRGREREGEVDAILVVLSDSATNRRLVDELRASLGPAYATSPRAIFSALRLGRRLVGSGVVLV